MTRTEFLSVIQWRMDELAWHIKGGSPKSIMLFKRELQMALSHYSKHGNGKLDSVQEKAISMIAKIEKWLRQAYFDYHKTKLLRDGKLTKQGIKSNLRNDFEKWNKEESY